MTVLGLIRELTLQGKLPLQNQERWGIQMVTARPTGPIVKEKIMTRDTCLKKKIVKQILFRKWGCFKNGIL